ncbi:hypothetical protein Dda_0799 [Drechslerella dactyloides]|uniref:Translation initiation factor IF-2, mitochondrial n=1 Tax=Drechslerella dactyloides TaxID=74499 RepID=A0AAD6J5J0_DREDA|nr:hypothetical protein Dda_0799 [Drechslerella dactyloides]
MRSSAVVLRSRTSPCLLCVLRAAAAAGEPTALRTSQRRLNRRVHSSANRESLAAQPKRDGDAQYDLHARQSSQFQGFGSDQTASVAAAKWAIKKPKPAEPPPTEDPSVEMPAAVQSDQSTQTDALADTQAPAPSAIQTAGDAGVQSQSPLDPPNQGSVSQIGTHQYDLYASHSPINTQESQSSYQNPPQAPPATNNWSQWNSDGSIAGSYRSFPAGKPQDPMIMRDHSEQELKDLRKQHIANIEGPSAGRNGAYTDPMGSSQFGSTTPSNSSRWNVGQPQTKASSGAAKWGVSTKKSVFADIPHTSPSDIAAFTAPDFFQAQSRGHETQDPWAASSNTQDPWNAQPTERSFHRFKTTPSAPAYGGYGAQRSFRASPVDEALEEARVMEEALLGSKKSKKKKQRGREDTSKAASGYAQEHEEANVWGRKASAKERDKLKYGRQWLVGDEEDIEEAESKAARKEKKRLEREQKAKEKLAQKQQLPPILIPEFVSISTLARMLKVKLEKFTVKMEELGFTEVNPDYVLNAEMAGLIAMEYKYEPIPDKSHERDLFPLPAPKDKSILPSRPPVVTIMGHVDHGKTTILDWLRKSSIVDMEHGGITQHIGAFSVTMPSGRVISFLDTPGHEAFLKMRERGANMTDIVILVVAGDDSIMPQTIEAIKHARAAQVPMIVAINKCDKEDADPARVKRDLFEHNVDIEDEGGDTQVVCVSGKTGLGMEDLEEAVLLQADDLDVRADNTGRVEGWIVETTTKTKGRVATVLVRRGTMRRGDVIVAGKAWARVRTLITENGLEIDEAPPGTPVEVDGWKDNPDAGDEVLQADSEDKAKSVVDYRLFKAERQQLAIDIEAINEQRRLHHEKREREALLKELEKQGEEGEQVEPPPEEDTASEKFKIIEVPFIVKADVAGSVEAVGAQVLSVANDELRTKIIRSGVGPLTESDIAMAQSTGAYCLAFNVPQEPEITALARFCNVKIIPHNLIYAVLDDIKALMSEKLKPIIIKTVVGEAQILQIFNYNVRKRIMRPFAGCRVTRGAVTKGSKTKIIRAGEVVYDGELETLKHKKAEVPKMMKDQECGMGFLKFDDFQEGDIVQCYTETAKKRTMQ